MLLGILILSNIQEAIAKTDYSENPNFVNTLDCTAWQTAINAEYEVNDNCEVAITFPDPTSTDPACTFTILEWRLNGNIIANPNMNYAPGSYNIEVVVDFGFAGTARCFDTFDVIDDTNPDIDCPPGTGMFSCYDDALFPEDGADGYIDYMALGGSATDNCAINPASFNTTYTLTSGPCPQVWTRRFEISDVMDAGGVNGAFCEDQITIEDLIDPTVTNPTDFDDLEYTVNELCEDAEVDLPALLADDNCDGAITITNDLDANGADPAAATFPVGTHTVTFTITDACGNPITFPVTFEVVDNSLPVFDPTDLDILVLMNGSPYDCDFVVPDPPLWTVTDNCSVDTEVTGTQSFTPDPILPCDGGTVTYSYTVTDDDGNTANTSFTITINADTEGPTVVLDLSGFPTNIDCDDDFPEFPSVLSSNDDCTALDANVMDIDTFYYTNDVARTVIDPADLADQVCSGYIVEYTWTPQDECGNMATQLSVEFIVNADTQPPTINCPDISVGTEPGECFALATNVPLPTDISDNCSQAMTVTYVSHSPADPELQKGVTYVFTWQVSDNCPANSPATCDQNVTVVDDELPACNTASGTAVSLTQQSFAIIPISAFNISGTDNCAAPGSITASIQRDTPGCIDPTDDQEVIVCCEDIADGAGTGTVMVQIILDDGCGNKGVSCMVAVTVSDKLPPAFEPCLPDLSVNCSYDFTDLSIFGSYLEENPTLNEVVEFSGATTSFYDGIVTDFCGIHSITETLDDQRDDCGEGDLIRVFTAIDIHGLSSTKTQTINVTNDDHLVLSDITPPTKYTILNNCMATTPDPTISGRPTWTFKNCSIVGASFTDIVSDNPNSGCPFILRKWKVIDWCQYEANGTSTDGLWEFEQTIEILNTEAPEIDCGTDLEVCTNEQTCLASINIEGQATDCTDAEDLAWNWTLINDNDASVNYQGNGRVMSEDVARGSYTITWVVDDRCGNVASCTQSLVVRDCKAPQPVCIHGIAINLNDMRAIAITNVADSTRVTSNQSVCDLYTCFQVTNNNLCDVTDFDISYTFTTPSGEFKADQSVGTALTSNSTTMICPTFSSDVFATAVAGTCHDVSDITMSWIISNNGPEVIEGSCPVGTPFGIMGTIWAQDYDASSSDNCTAHEDLIFSFSANVSETSRTFTCDDLGENPISMWVTDEDGNQSSCQTFILVQDNHGVCPLIPERIEITGKVESYDHRILEQVRVELKNQNDQIEDFTDASGSYAFQDLEMYEDFVVAPEFENPYLNGVSTLDLVMIQRHILGQEDLANPYKILAADVNTSNTVDAIDLLQIRKLILGITTEFHDTPSWKFVDAAHSFLDDQNPWVYPTQMEMYDLDYNAAEMNFVGVKTGDVNGSVQVNLHEESIEERSGEIRLSTNHHNGNVVVKATEDMSAYGLQMTIDGTFENQVTIESPLNDFTEKNYALNNNQIILSWNSEEITEIKKGEILFTIKEAKEISINSTLAKAEMYNDQLEINSIVQIRSDRTTNNFEVGQNHPNPFQINTTFDLYLPVEGVVKMELYDVNGRKLHMSSKFLVQGENTITIHSKMLNGYNGIIYSNFEYQNERVTKSMVKIKL